MKHSTRRRTACRGCLKRGRNATVTARFQQDMLVADVNSIGLVNAPRIGPTATMTFSNTLYRAVLEAIAEGRCGTPAACASAALTTQQMNFSRWYAYPPTCPR